MLPTIDTIFAMIIVAITLTLAIAISKRLNLSSKAWALIFSSAHVLKAENMFFILSKKFSYDFSGELAFNSLAPVIKFTTLSLKSEMALPTGMSHLSIVSRKFSNLSLLEKASSTPTSQLLIAETSVVNIFPNGDKTVTTFEPICPMNFSPVHIICRPAPNPLATVFTNSRVFENVVTVSVVSPIMIGVCSPKTSLIFSPSLSNVF